MSGKPPDTFRENVLLDPHFPIYKHLNGVFFLGQNFQRDHKLENKSIT